ncbi:hypothetical protein [Streptosporangium sp. NPDC048865]|uniref:hypothetical protein n=1 Tax=Streptosporangium sp. NPDC048865 TaxID=3155766 RepID=UPI00342AC88C
MRKTRADDFAAPAPLSLAASLSLLLALGAPAPAAAAASSVPATTTAASATVVMRADQLSISVPTTANFGSRTTGDTFSASLGTVTVADSRGGIPPWTATVSATDLTTGGGSPAQTITKANITYWSGPSVTSSGGGSRTPGQVSSTEKVALTTSVIAFRARKGTLFATSTSWQPTLVITVPASAAAGVYTGVITHSVA